MLFFNLLCLKHSWLWPLWTCQVVFCVLRFCLFFFYINFFFEKDCRIGDEGVCVVVEEFKHRNLLELMLGSWVFFVFFCYCQFFYADTFFRDTENEITDTGIKHLCDGLAAVYENPRLVGFALLKKLDIRENLWTPEGLLPLFAHGHEHLTILTEGF